MTKVCNQDVCVCLYESGGGLGQRYSEADACNERIWFAGAGMP